MVAARRAAPRRQLARACFGVAALIGVSRVATVVLLPRTPPPARRERITEPILALRHGALATTSVVGLLYDWGFITCSATPRS